MTVCADLLICSVSLFLIISPCQEMPIDMLKNLVQWIKISNFACGERIMKQGEQLASTWIVLNGKVH